MWCFYIKYMQLNILPSQGSWGDAILLFIVSKFSLRRKCNAATFQYYATGNSYRTIHLHLMLQYINQGSFTNQFIWWLYETHMAWPSRFQPSHGSCPLQWLMYCCAHRESSWLRSATSASVSKWWWQPPPWWMVEWFNTNLMTQACNATI